MAQQGEAGMFSNAASYEQFMGRLSRSLAPTFLRFAAIGDASKVLDVGSGTGSLAECVALAYPACSIVGIDPSAEYVAFSSAKSPTGRLRYEVGDALHLESHVGTFDAAVSQLVFNFISQPEQALIQLCRVVRPGGVIAAAVWDYGGGMEVLREFWDAAAALDPGASALDEKHMPLCRQGELAALWQRAGLKEVNETCLEIDVRFDSYADYWRPFLLGQGPAGSYVKRLAASQVEALAAELERRLPSAPFTLSAKSWAVRGINRHQ